MWQPRWFSEKSLATIFPHVKNTSKESNMSEKNRKVMGPASYFPSIEKQYGFPVNHWFDLLTEKKGLKHMEMVAWLKSEHKMGHGHANALVAHFRNQEGL